MAALLLGSIGVLAETSHLQRGAFNAAFAEAGLDWHWSEARYSELLARSGGADRIATEAKSRGASVDVAALHARKSVLFRKELTKGVPLRPGVAETIQAARAAGDTVALVTTTSLANVDAVLKATGLSHSGFDLILTRGDVTDPKPAPEVYAVALARLGHPAARAVEDNPDGLRAALGAGLTCTAFPGAMHEAARFDGASAVVRSLTLPAVPDP
ncbi:MAG: HAD-IA family hydrolase [Alphaproteobacteria bacterium]|nr:HAD-IA family hydrolase [Alphaproteobacteria bacterium]